MELEIDHIGYLTDSIERTACDFINLGYTKGEVYQDDNQNTYICFMTKHGATNVELVEPYEDNAKMQKMFKRQGGIGPYHICYAVNKIDEAFENMSNMGYLPMFAPVEAIAFNNRKICYFWKKSIGYIELVEKNI